MYLSRSTGRFSFIFHCKAWRIFFLKQGNVNIRRVCLLKTGSSKLPFRSCVMTCIKNYSRAWWKSVPQRSAVFLIYCTHFLRAWRQHQDTGPVVSRKNSARWSYTDLLSSSPLTSPLSVKFDVNEMLFDFENFNEILLATIIVLASVRTPLRSSS